MRNKLYVSLVVLALLFAGIWTAYAQRSTPVRQAWEYKSIVIVRPARSNADFTSWAEVSGEVVKELPLPVFVPVKAKELGDQGWELTAVTPISNHSCGTQDCAGFTSQIIYFFKRPK